MTEKKKCNLPFGLRQAVSNDDGVDNAIDCEAQASNVVKLRRG